MQLQAENVKHETKCKVKVLPAAVPWRHIMKTFQL